MRELIDYADIFILCSAGNHRQVQAIAHAMRHWAKHEHQLLPNGVEGVEAGRWVLVDFGAVVVHIFDEPLRGFYNLDGLWKDAPRLEVPTTEEVEASQY